MAQIGGWPIPQVLDVSNGFQVGLFSLSISVLVAEITRPWWNNSWRLHLFQSFKVTSQIVDG